MTDKKIADYLAKTLGEIERDTCGTIQFSQLSGSIMLFTGTTGHRIEVDYVATATIGLSKKEKYEATFAFEAKIGKERATQQHVEEAFRLLKRILKSLDAAENGIGVFLCRSMTDDAQDFCKQKGFSYITLDGAVFIKADHLFYVKPSSRSEHPFSSTLSATSTEDQILGKLTYQRVLSVMVADLNADYSVTSLVKNKKVSVSPAYKVIQFLIENKYAKFTGQRKEFKLTDQGKQWMKDNLGMINS